MSDRILDIGDTLTREGETFEVVSVSETNEKFTYGIQLESDVEREEEE